MGAQLSLKAALPLAEIFATASDRCSNIGSRRARLQRRVYECERIAFRSDLRPYSFVPSLLMTSSNGNIFRVTGPLCGEIHRSPVNSPHKLQ